MQRLSVRLPDPIIAQLETMLAALPEPTIGPKPTMADVLRVVVERGLEPRQLEVVVNGIPATVEIHSGGSLAVNTTTDRYSIEYRRK